MSNDDRLETRIVRCKTPGWQRRWRWDVVKYRPAEGVYPGVLDRRVHLIGYCGYTATWLGAALAIGRRVRTQP